MSWAEVKKINSDLSTPLNELMEYEQKPYSFSKLTYNGAIATGGVEISVTTPALIYAITCAGACYSANTVPRFDATITLDNDTYRIVFENNGYEAYIHMGFIANYMTQPYGNNIRKTGIVGYSAVSSSTQNIPSFVRPGIQSCDYELDSEFFMPSANSTLNINPNRNSTRTYSCIQPLEKPIKVNSLAKVKCSSSYRNGYLAILYKPLS